MSLAQAAVIANASGLEFGTMMASLLFGLLTTFGVSLTNLAKSLKHSSMVRKDVSG